MSQPIPPNPLISVVMPVYNRAPYVAEAIQSIVAQTYSRWELIVVDDGSTDDSPRILREWAGRDARIRAIFLDHGGVSRAMNAGVRAARGEMLARLDSDDIALPQRFAVQLEWLRQHEVDLCGTCMVRFGDKRGPVWFPQSHEAIRRELIFRCPILFPTVLMRAEIYQPIDERVHADDYELLSQLAPRYRFGNVPRLLVKYRRHRRQTGVVKQREFKGEVKTIRRRCFDGLFPNATKEERALYMQIVDKVPFAKAEGLARAGEWLTTLAQIPDRLLHQQMAMRWRGICRISARLGAECYRVYQEWLPKIDSAAQLDDRAMWWACALRLKPKSRLDPLLIRAFK